jgi:uncharacterized protein
VKLSPNVTLIVKVTNACDMKCRYCFIEPSVFHKSMSLETASLVVRSFLDAEHFEQVHFVWHGGEPLLRGRRFFEHVFAEQAARPTKTRFRNSTQTNATHLDDDMLEFLAANDVAIGLSLDGPPQLNDTARLMRRRSDVRSRHAVTTDAAHRIQARGLPAAAIVTVNRCNVGDPEAVYAEYRGRGIHMKINPLTRSGLAATPVGDDLGVTAEEYGEFLASMFDLWFDDPEPVISIEPFVQHGRRALGVETTESCFFTRRCHHFFLGIAPDGLLFPCGMFQGEPDFAYGNLHEMSPTDVAATALFGRIEDRENKVMRDCMHCAFFDLCYSGCMFHSLKDGKVVEEKDYYCAGYRIYFERLLTRLRDDLAAGGPRTSRPEFTLWAAPQ